MLLRGRLHGAHATCVRACCATIRGPLLLQSRRSLFMHNMMPNEENQGWREALTHLNPVSVS